MYTAMKGDVLPKLEVVKAIIIGCGGGEDDLRLFASAWRRLDAARTQHPADGGHHGLSAALSMSRAG
jgi:hypothetical protein